MRNSGSRSPTDVEWCCQSSAVRVEADRGVVVDVSGWDDVSMVITYLGPDLCLHSGRFGCPDDDNDDEFVAKFLAKAQSWLAAGCEKELLWVVKVELRLASLSVNLV
jgi:hypothetical protein